MVQRDEIDFIVCDLSYSVQRQTVVDHLFPIYDYFHSLIYWRPESKVGWTQYISVFDPTLWCSLLAMAVSSTLVLWLQRRKERENSLAEAGAFVAACIFNRLLMNINSCLFAELIM